MKFWIPILLLLLSFDTYSQATRKVSAMLNRRQRNQLIPTLSGDGREIIYLSDLKDEGDLNLWYSRKISSGAWKQPEVLPITVDMPSTNLVGGHNLSFDGKILLFTSRRRGSIGGYDIWISEKEGNNWGAPRNAGKPVNSDLHEGDPFFSRDGRFLYFMRCQQLSNNRADGCEIMVAEIKSNGYFNEPKPLPSPINTGNETTPRIMADNVTLLFASSRSGGQGGYDLYVSTRTGNTWSKPAPLNFLNTEDDDRYLNIPVQGDIGYFSRENEGYQTLYMVKIPPELQPKKVLWINGKVQDKLTKEPVEGIVRIYDAITNNFVESMLTSPDGSFSAFLSQGSVYDFSIMAKEENLTFYSSLFDLDSLSSSRKQNQLVELESIKPGKNIDLEALRFIPYSTEIDPKSSFELQRVTALLKRNPDLKAEIGVHLKTHLSDSVFSDPDLTELVVDTLIDYRVIDIIDSVLSEVNNELLDSLQQDTTAFDSLRNVVLTYEPVLKKDTLTILKIIRTYHNDRTQKQADKILEHLLDQGLSPGSLIAVGYGDSKKSLYKEEFEGNIKVFLKFFQ